MRFFSKNLIFNNSGKHVRPFNKSSQLYKIKDIISLHSIRNNCEREIPAGMEIMDKPLTKATNDFAKAD